MTAVIHKQRLAYIPEQVFDAHGDVGAIRAVQVQRDVPCIWYEVDTAASPGMQAQVTVRLVGTGDPRPLHPFRYAGTTQQHDGAFVWHWYIKLDYPKL